MDLTPILELMRQSPVSGGIASVVEHFVRGSQTLLPKLAVGACIVDAEPNAPIVVTLLPRESAVPLGRDPSRLFPGFADERIFELDDGARGSTYHVACDTQSLSPEVLGLAQAISGALGPMIKHARAHEAVTRRASVPVRAHGNMIQTEKLASLGQIVAGIVHELNNPLTTIIAYSDYLKKRTIKRSEAGEEVGDDLERLRRIGEAAERILKFSRDLVAYARPSTDIPGPVALSEVIEQAIVFCEHEFGKNSVSLKKQVEPHLPPVRGISGQLTQVFVNLFTNAAHAMQHTGGLLEIDAALADEETVLVEVADNGVGIPEPDLEHIFEPFFTTKGDGSGTGLGLSIVRDIVTRHGGDLTAARRTQGGTVFRLHLPVVVVPPSMRPPRT